jgi:serine/threonine protein kinase
MAPEVALGKSFNEKADLWSLGIILFEMIAGKVPFKGSTHFEILQLIERGQYSLPDGVMISSVCKNMITSLIMTDVEVRINFKDFGKHPFTSLSPEEY